VHRTLGRYLYELVGRLGADDPAAVSRIREIVGHRRARIRLDHEVAEAWFDAAGFSVVEEATSIPIDGEGAADRRTILDILDARLEATAAVVDGDIHITGDPDNVIRMLHAIEILLDGSVRSPSLQALAEDFRRDRGDGTLRRAPLRPAKAEPDPKRNEMSLLRRLDLLPDGAERRARTRRRSV
jgi:hypothetical protein